MERKVHSATVGHTGIREPIENRPAIIAGRENDVTQRARGLVVAGEACWGQKNPP